MEENRKKVLGTVSAFALSAVIGGAAVAAVPAEESARVPEAASPAVRAGDLFVELMLRTGGTVTATSIAGELRTMLAPLTEAQLAELPGLIRNIRGLGLGADVEATATDTLLDLVATADLPLDDRQLEALAVALADRPESFQLAAVQNNPGTGKASATGKSKASPRGKERGNGLYEG